MDRENDLLIENERLRKRLQEAEDLIDAIRSGRIDALVVSRPDEYSIYTLKGADHTYRVLIETMDEGAVILSKEGTILYCNRSFAEMVQTPISQVAGNTITGFIALQDRERFCGLHDKVYSEEGSKTEICLQTAHTAVVPALVSLRQLSTDDLQTTCMVVTDLTEQKETEITLHNQNAELKSRAEQLARLSSELTIVEQRERRRLAELLHDDLQQLLAGARLNLEMAFQGDSTRQNSAIRDACALVAQSLETSRTLSAELSPPVLYMYGLAEALKWLARWMEKTHNLQIDLHADPQVDVTQEDFRILLFQSVRELLFNVVKHAQTDTARVEMKRQNEQIVIAVRDRGIGFDPSNLWLSDHQADGGFGLFTIRERLQLLGGAFDIESTSSGTTVTLTAPLQTHRLGRAKTHPLPAGEQRLPATGREPPAATPRDGAIRVLLVDDHAVMRQGLSLMLSRHDDLIIVGEAADGQQAIELAYRVNPGVILMDISMPIMDGIEATRIIHSQMPRIQIIALSMHAADDQAAMVKQAGAVAYLNKSGDSEKILATIRQYGKPGARSEAAMAR